VETPSCRYLTFRSFSPPRRYLVHAIGTYYGLKTWSVTTTGSPARREAYVSLDVDGQTQRPSLSAADMPRPLWAVI
jgi:hypothetical protein